MNAVLRKLSDDQLIEIGEVAVRREHLGGVRILEVLLEMDRRSLYRERGYASLFDYCTRRWRYSSSKAGRYIAAARAMGRYPSLRDLLVERRITICGAARLAQVLRPENWSDLLASAAGKTFAEIDAMVARHRVAPSIPDRVRPVGVVRKAELFRGDAGLLPGTEKPGAGGGCPADGRRGRDGGCSEAAPGAETTNVAVLPGGHEIWLSSEGRSVHSQRGRTEPSASKGGAVVSASTSIESAPGSPLGLDPGLDPGPDAGAAEECDPHYEVRFLTSRRFFEKLGRARSVFSSRPSLEAVLEKALDELLERHDPVRKRERRTARTRRQTARANGRASRVREAKGGAGEVAGEDGCEAEFGDAEEAVSEAGVGIAVPAVSESAVAVPREVAGVDASGSGETETAVTRPDTDDNARPTSGAGSAARSSVSRAQASSNSGRRRRSRHIPNEVRDEVFERDRGRCTFVGVDGRVCGSKTYLQVDHVVPFAQGGSHLPTNLRLLCGVHNRLKAERRLGAVAGTWRPAPTR